MQEKGEVKSLYFAKFTGETIFCSVTNVTDFSKTTHYL